MVESQSTNYIMLWLKEAKLEISNLLPRELWVDLVLV
jgi:hypothetical protein